jgi:hypothetical protein
MEVGQMVKTHHKEKDDKTWCTQGMFVIQNDQKFQTLPVTLLYNEPPIFIPGAVTDQQCYAV